MFIGEYQHTIDSKGRVFMPAKFREKLGEKFVVTKGLDNCLFVYPNEEWQSLESKLRTLPLTSREARAFIRFFFAGAAECEADKQGRILIPANLREYASLEKELSIIGVSTRRNLGQETWEYNGQSSLDQESIIEKMAAGI